MYFISFSENCIENQSLFANKVPNVTLSYKYMSDLCVLKILYS